MFLTTHALTGAFLATKISSPVYSYPFVLAIHFAMDRIPHWDFGTGLRRSDGRVALAKRKKAVFLGLFDLLAALSSSWLFFQKTWPPNLALWGGVFLSLLPDFLEIPPLFFNLWFFPFQKLDQLHSHFFHRGAPFPKGIFSQLVILALIFYFTLAT